MEKKGSSEFIGPESSGLRFNTQQDAFDYADKLVKHSNDWFASHELNISERYSKGEISLILSPLVIGNTDYDLIFAVKKPANIHFSSIAESALRGDGVDCASDSKRAEDCMLLSVAYPVQGPEGSIPSFVWLESFKKRFDFIRDILGFSLFRVKLPLKIVEVVSERKVRVSRISNSDSFADSKTRMIQHGSQIHDGICNYTRKVNGKRWEFDYTKFLKSLKIILTEVDMSIVCSEIPNPLLQISNVFLSGRFTASDVGRLEKVAPE